MVLGAALVFSGAFLVFKPPVSGLAKPLAYGMLGLLLCGLVGLLPQAILPTAEWRAQAVSDYGIQLPYSLSVQPGVSLESLVSMFAAMVWFAALSSYPINHEGWKRLLFWLSVSFSLLALVLIIAGRLGHGYLGLAPRSAFGTYPSEAQTTGLMLMGAVASTAFALHGLRARSSLNLAGFVSAALCLYVLIVGGAETALRLYVISVIIWLLLQVRRVSCRPRLLALSALFLLLVVTQLAWNQPLAWCADLVSDPLSLASDGRAQVYGDTGGLLRETGLFGVGLASFAAAMPQYRVDSVSPDAIVHPGSDLLWWAVETGLLGMLALVILLVSYVRTCRPLTEGRTAPYRMIAFFALSAFGLHMLLDVPGRSVGTVYLALLFASLALPRHIERPVGMGSKPMRLIGTVLVCIGLLWALGPAVGVNLHSLSKQAYVDQRFDTGLLVDDPTRAAQLIEGSLKRFPMDWRLYQQRAQLALDSGAGKDAAAADFRRARFVEPVQAEVSLAEGFAWIAHDIDRAVSAWQDSFSRESANRAIDFQRIIEAAKDEPRMSDRMSEMSRGNSAFRQQYLLSLEADVFYGELASDLRKDPLLSDYTDAKRLQLLVRWVPLEDAKRVEAYLKTHADRIQQGWRLWAVYHYTQARFQTAVELIRDSVDRPVLTDAQMIEPAELAKAQRSYDVLPTSLSKGLGLLQSYIAAGLYAEALGVLATMEEQEEVPDSLEYWRGEVHYLMEEYIESWYAFESYLDQ